MNKMHEIYKRSKFKIKQNAYLFNLVGGFFEDSKKVKITTATDIVIEGPWRTGNHYAVALLLEAFNGINIAHHFHTPAQAILAHKFEIPAVVLVREPIECIVSSCQLNNANNFNFFIDFYLNFYKALPNVSKFIHIVMMEDMIKNPNGFIKFIESKVKIKSVEKLINQQDVFKKIDKIFYDEMNNERLIPIPSNLKNEKKNKIKSLLHLEADRIKLLECVDLYKKLQNRKVILSI